MVGEAGTLAGFLCRATQALPAAALTLSTFVHTWPYSSASFLNAIFILPLFQRFLELGHLCLVQEEVQALAQQSTTQGSTVPGRPVPQPRSGGGNLARAQQAQKPSRDVGEVTLPVGGSDFILILS